MSAVKDSTTVERVAHTAGPWFVGAQNDALFVVAGKPPAQGNDYPDHDAERTVIAGPLQLADAKLIAAAPDLLVALKVARSYVITIRDHSRASVYIAAMASTDLDVIDAALAKAEQP